MIFCRSIFGVYSESGWGISIFIGEFRIIGNDFGGRFIRYNFGFKWRIFDGFIFIGDINGVIIRFSGSVVYIYCFIWFFG